MLQQLASLAKFFSALTTFIREFRNLVVGLVSIVCQHGHLCHVLMHQVLLRSKIVNQLPTISLPRASAAVSTLNMLNSVGPRTKAHFATDGTCHVSGAMNLLVHVQFVLGVENTVASCALVRRGWRLVRRGCRLPVVVIHAVEATRGTITFHPLVSTEARKAQMSITCCAYSAHVILVCLTFGRKCRMADNYKCILYDFESCVKCNGQK